MYISIIDDSTIDSQTFWHWIVTNDDCDLIIWCDHIAMYVCVYVSMYVCSDVCMCVCICMYVPMYLYVCMYDVCMYVCVYSLASWPPAIAAIGLNCTWHILCAK